MTARATKLTKKQLKTEQFRDKGKKDTSEVEIRSGPNEGEDVSMNVEEEQVIQKKKKKKVDHKRVNERSDLLPLEEDAKQDEVNLKQEKKEKMEKKEKKAKMEKVEDKEKEERKRKRKDGKTDETENSISEEKQGQQSDVEKSNKKRKRDEGTLEKVKRTKKRFTEDGKVEEIVVEDAAAAAREVDEDKNNDKRYIIFVGNMSFQSTTDQIAKHFLSHCGEAPTVRLLTKKGDSKKLAELSKSKQKSIAKGRAADPSAPISKGCAFVEFKTSTALQKALQFHHTVFQGRTINVELTAGGGGAGNGRKEKIRKKNQELEVERQKLHEKYVKTNDKKTEKKKDGEFMIAEKPKEQIPAWGPRASAAAKQRGMTKIPRWAASGANAVKMSG